MNTTQQICLLVPSTYPAAGRDDPECAGERHGPTKCRGQTMKTVLRSIQSCLHYAAATFIALIASGGAHAASTLHWPTDPACSGTLQSCIDTVASDGDTVLVEADGGSTRTINETIVITKSLTLSADALVDAVFSNGQGINVTSPTTGAVNVTVQRLSFKNGSISVDHRSDTASTYTLSQLSMDGTDGNTTGCAIYMVDTGAGSPHFIIGDSRLRTRSTPAGTNGFCASGYDGGPWQVDFFRNQVRVDNGSLNVALLVAGTSNGSVRIRSNRVTGNGYPSGIVVSQNLGSLGNTIDIQDNAVIGEDTPALTDAAAIRVIVANSSVHIVNNTLVGNAKGLLVERFGADSSSGRVANNLVAFNSIVGLGLDTFVTNDYNLVYGNGGDTYTPGAHTITSDPEIVGLWNPRLTTASPARNAGNNADVNTFLGLDFDADGEPRFVNGTPTPTVDIGAYELNQDFAVVQSSNAGNTLSDTTLVDALAYIISSNERLLVTAHHSAVAGAEAIANLGVYETSLSPSFWAIYREDTLDLSYGRNYSVLAPFDGRPAYVHTSSPSNIGSNLTRLDQSDLNSTPGAIAFIAHNWNPAGIGGTYHDHPLALSYSAPSWYISNEDLADMASGVSFNVVVAPFGSPNAFVVRSNASTVVTLAHPMLDDNPCAAPFVTRNDGTSGPTNDIPFSVDYARGQNGAPGHWRIVAEGSPPPAFVNGSGFNVMVQGAQADACRDDVIFADPFEG